MESLIVFEMKKGRILTFSLKLFSVYVLIMTPSNQSFGGYHMFFFETAVCYLEGFHFIGPCETSQKVNQTQI